jgi:hypothetical protein
MMDFENIKINCGPPPIARSGRKGGFCVDCNADLILVLVDLASDDVFEQVEQVRVNWPPIRYG